MSCQQREKDKSNFEQSHGGLTNHGDRVTGIGRDLLPTELRVLEGASPHAPLARLAAAVGAGAEKGDGQRLDQVAAAGAHARPQREAFDLGAGHLGQYQGRVGGADP